MRKEEIKKILNIIFYKDYLEKSKKKEKYFEDIFFEESEIFLITLKSVALREDKLGGIVDYNRLLKELSTWKYYRHTNNETIIRVLNKDYSKTRNEDFKEIGMASLAIILSNENITTVLSEILKMSLFFTENIELILKNYYESIVVFNLINEKSVEEALLDAKKRFIELSLKNEIEENNIFLKDLDTRNYILEFEKERIKIIMSISNLDLNDFDITKLKIGNIIEKFLEGAEYPDTTMSVGLYDYIYKLRKGRIGINSFKSFETDNIDYFSLEKNKLTRDPIFGRIKLLEVVQQDKYELRYIETKIANFRLFRKK